MRTKMYSFITAGVFFAVLLQGCPEERVETPSTSESGNMIVYVPQPGDTVSSPVTVRGKARVFEAALSVRVLSGDGVDMGFVEAFSFSPKDGSRINVVRIPVRFR